MRILFQKSQVFWTRFFLQYCDRILFKKLKFSRKIFIRIYRCYHFILLRVADYMVCNPCLGKPICFQQQRLTRALPMIFYWERPQSDEITHTTSTFVTIISTAHWLYCMIFASTRPSWFQSSLGQLIQFQWRLLFASMRALGWSPHFKKVAGVFRIEEVPVIPKK